MKIPITSTPGFYEARDFNQIGKPLVYTEARSKLTPIKWGDLHKLKGVYDVTIKTDGKFVRVIKKDNLIRMITSSGLDFYHNSMAFLMKDMPDGQYNMECQYLDGLLKSRDNTGYLTTACTNYRKQLPDAGDWPSIGLCFQVHDFLPSSPGLQLGYMTSTDYISRRFILAKNFDFYMPHGQTLIKFPRSVRYATFLEPQAELLRYTLVKDLDYDPQIHEGLVFMGVDEPYRLPINPNNFKLKNVCEVIGTVIGVEQDKNGGNGTLVLEVIDGSPNGSECRVSSGMDNKLRSAPTKHLMNKRVEVEYESITTDGHYNQPRIKRFDI